MSLPMTATLQNRDAAMESFWNVKSSSFVFFWLDLFVKRVATTNFKLKIIYHPKISGNMKIITVSYVKLSTTPNTEQQLFYKVTETKRKNTVDSNKMSVFVVLCDDKSSVFFFSRNSMNSSSYINLWFP